MGESRGVVNDVPHRLRVFAKRQRSDMTRAEALFWAQVRAGRFGGYKFKRQVPVAPFIVDFMCPSERLIVELDGPPHQNAEARARARDGQRDAFLAGQGFRVLRFANDEVLGGLNLVLAEIRAALAFPSPASLREAPSPAQGERVAHGDRETCR